MRKKTRTEIEQTDVDTKNIYAPMLEDELGRVLRSKDIAVYLEIDEKTVRQYYLQLGGIRLGRLILFFEKEVINAIQKGSTMGGPGASMRQEEGENLPEQEGCNNVGKRDPVKSREGMACEDRHGLFV